MLISNNNNKNNNNNSCHSMTKKVITPCLSPLEDRRGSPPPINCPTKNENKANKVITAEACLLVCYLPLGSITIRNC